MKQQNYCEEFPSSELELTSSISIKSQTGVARSLVSQEGFVVADILSVFVHDLVGGEGTQRVVFGALMTFLAVPRRFIVLAVYRTVALPGAPEKESQGYITTQATDGT